MPAILPTLYINPMHTLLVPEGDEEALCPAERTGLSLGEWKRASTWLYDRWVPGAAR